MTKPLPIGISDFKRIIDDGYAYVDKTLLMKELIEKRCGVALIPRLRRFGKTLNLSMLRYFFEKAEEDTSYLFKNLKIGKCEQCMEMQGQFPVIFLTFKDIKHASWENAFVHFRRVLAEEFDRHAYLLKEGVLTAAEQGKYLKILCTESDQPLCEEGLRLLINWMHRYHKKPIVLLIDEYDTPAHAAYVGQYYKPMIDFLRNLLSGALKDNTHLQVGVLTGILRIAKESIFSGLNNISTCTLLDETFQDKFGLLEWEVKELLQQYGLADKLSDASQWYDGYRIGSCVGIYNPWSVLQYIATNGKLAPYWVNTSDNALMKQLIVQGPADLKADLEELLKGGIIEKTIEEGIVFSDLGKNSNSIWSLLLFSGYLTIAATPVYGIPCKLRIPNIEVAELYKSLILGWFDQTIHETHYRLLLNSLISGDIETFAEIFQEFLFSAVSAFDVPAGDSEKIYHAFVLGMLIGLKGRYEIKSNRESGLGRYDVTLIPKNPSELGIIMEFKKISAFKKMDLETAVAAALQQIEDKQYAQELLRRGIHRILYLGFAFEGKQVLIRHKYRD